METFWQRLSWPQVAALGLVIGGTIAFLVLVPPDTLERIARYDWGAIVAGTLAIAGALFGTAGGPIVRPRTGPPSLPPMSSYHPPPEAPREGDD
jgi:hypothetical protein